MIFGKGKKSGHCSLKLKQFYILHIKMFTKIISAKHVSHSVRCSDKDRTFEFWSFLIKVYQKCRRVFENFCSSKKKKKMFVKETFCWNTQYKILGKTIRWGKWWICQHIKLLTFVSDFRQKWNIKQISYSSNSYVLYFTSQP